MYNHDEKGEEEKSIPVSNKALVDFFFFIYFWLQRGSVGLPGWLSSIEPRCQYERHKSPGFDAWVGKIPWRRAWRPTPIFLPGESQGQRSLLGRSPKSQTGLSSHAEGLALVVASVGYSVVAEHGVWARGLSRQLPDPGVRAR